MNTKSELPRTLPAILIAWIVLFALAPTHAEDTVRVNTHAAEKPRLVLQITVDQFRGDLPTRYFDRLGKGGLRYLLEEGIHYNNAHHGHANTETIVGHVTLATGAHPAGMNPEQSWTTYPQVSFNPLQIKPHPGRPGAGKPWFS